MVVLFKKLSLCAKSGKNFILKKNQSEKISFPYNYFKIALPIDFYAWDCRASYP
jgi:hypothetical protein